MTHSDLEQLKAKCSVILVKTLKEERRRNADANSVNQEVVLGQLLFDSSTHRNTVLLD